MSIETDVFKKYHIVESKCLEYGFNKIGNSFFYSFFFLDNQFKGELTVSDKITGRVIEVELDEEYSNIRIDSFKGEFVSRVREAYISRLEEIRSFCFESNSFIYEQSNRIEKYIQSKYGIYLDHPFKEENIAVFRSKINSKWFGLIMELGGKRFNKSKSIEILNVKMHPNHIPSLLQKDGFYVAYHMDKKNWITIVLDDSLEDETIFSCIDESYELIHSKQYWIVPANPKMYDVFNHFENNEDIIWKQTTKVNVGDYVYIYITKPFAAIFYRCIVIENDIPYKDKFIMRLMLVNKYDNPITMDTLSSLGVPNIRCTRKIDKKIIEQFD